ncbi:MAG: acyltransferase, partial [Chitinophagaceae bacterium]
MSLSNENKANSRLTWVDHARGIAIMLVVYRHVVSGLRRANVHVSENLANVQEVFHNFRMPVFFVVSGLFVAFGLRRKTRKDILVNRSKTILYPYIVWALINTTLQIFFSSHTNSKKGILDYANIIIQPRNVDHLWYLLALFNTSVLYLLISKYVKNKWAHLLLALGLNFLSIQPILNNNSLFADMFHFYIYFVLGGFLTDILFDEKNRDKFLSPFNLLWVLPLFFTGQYLWFTHREVEHDYFLAFLVINLVACYFVFLITKQLSKVAAFDFLAKLGTFSLYIYI